MNNQLRLLRPRTAAFLVGAACVCSACLKAYFGAEWGGMASFLCCLLLFFCAAALRPERKEAAACLLSGGVFGVMHTLGYSYDAVDSYGLILKNTRTLTTGVLCMLSLSMVACCVCLILVRLLDHLSKHCADDETVKKEERKSHRLQDM